MGSNEEDKFYMVANAYSAHGMPDNFLTEPPIIVFHNELDVEKRAVELATRYPKRKYVVLEAKAIVTIKKDIPIWQEMNT